MKHTNFDNEITGEYYKDRNIDLPLMVFVIAIVLGIIVVVIEFSGLADWLLEILA